MPGFDGTGPRGQGPFTGGGRGYCVGYSAVNANYFTGGAGYGRGFGRGFGRGRGFIRRGQFVPGTSFYDSIPDHKKQVEFLEEQARIIQEEINFLKQEKKLINEKIITQNSNTKRRKES